MMDRKRANDIFEEAIALPPYERDAFAEKACNGDSETLDEVRSLLAAFDRAGSFFASPTVANSFEAAVAPSRDMSGSSIGPFRLLELIGEGGFGSVYMADQLRPIRRRVALKVLKPGMDSRQVIARFEAERQALAMMDHPSIAKVLDAGTTSPEQGSLPYFVMELVRGVTITQYCDDARLSARERLALLIPVCQAVQHAHQKGIIHRDIKPSNVLVTEQDGVPLAQVIDFGIAKATGTALTDKTVFTEFRQLIGTPAYMSPEQAGLGGLDVDTRSDVYSLGVLMYELLTGSTPFASADLLRAGVGEMQRIIREQEPPKPSTRVSTAGQSLIVLAQQRSTTPERLGKLVRGELDWIVMRALEKNRSRRYDTASSLAADLQRYLSGEAVLARPASPAYRFQKLVTRHKAVAAATIAVAGALLLGLGAASVGFYKAATDRDRARLAESEQTRLRHAAETARTEAEAAAVKARAAEQTEAAARQTASRQAARAQALLSFSDLMIGSANPDVTSTADTTTREMLQSAAARAGEFFKDHPESELAIRTRIGRAFFAQRDRDAALAQFVRADELARRTPELSAEDRLNLYFPYCVANAMLDEARVAPWLRFVEAARDLISARDPEVWRLMESMRATGLIWSQLDEPRAHAILAEIDKAIRERLKLGTPAGDAGVAMLVSWTGQASTRRDLATDPDAYSRVAVDGYERCLALLRETRGESNSDIVLVRQWYVETLRDMKDYPRALAAAREWGAAAERVLPDGHWLLAQIQCYQGVLEFRLGHFAEAVALLEPAIERVEKAPGLRNLANDFAERAAQSYTALGRLEDAARWERKAAAWCLENGRDPRTPAVMRRLFTGPQEPLGEAMICTDAMLEARSAEAGPAMLEVVDLARKLCRPGDPSARVFLKWGMYYSGAYESGRESPGMNLKIRSALEVYLLELARAVPEASNRTIAQLTYHIGLRQTLDAAEDPAPPSRLQSGEALLREAVERVRTFDPEMVYLQQVLSWLGRNLYLQGRYQEALDTMGDCMTAIGDEAGYHSIYAAHALQRRVLCLQALHRDEEARQVIASYMKHDGAMDMSGVQLAIESRALLRGGGQSPEHVQLALAMARKAVRVEPKSPAGGAALLLALRRAGHDSEALAHANRMLRGELLGGLSATDANLLVWMLVQHRNVEPALAGQAADALAPFVAKSPKNAPMANTLAVALLRAGRLKESEALARVRIVSMKSEGFSTDPTVGDYATLALALHAQGRAEEARGVLKSIPASLQTGPIDDDDQGLMSEARELLKDGDSR